MNTHHNTHNEADGLNPASAALNWLQQHENGVILQQLGEELVKTLLAVENHPGEKSVAMITLRIGIRRVENKPLVEIGHEITAKLPKPPTSTVLFWTDGTGRLHQNNPQQRTFQADGFVIAAPHVPLRGAAIS